MLSESINFSGSWKISVMNSKHLCQNMLSYHVTEVKSVPPSAIFKLDPTPKPIVTHYTNVTCKWGRVKSLYIPLLHFTELWSFYMVSHLLSLCGNKQDIFSPRLWFKIVTCCKSKLAALKFTNLLRICLKQESELPLKIIHVDVDPHWPSCILQ